jgi:hypothetical protein
MIAPPAPGQSIASSILSALPVIGAFFQGYTTGLVARALQELKELRDAIIWVADNVARVIGRVARWADAAVRGLRWIWTNVIRPILYHIQQLFDRLAKLIDKVLKPYLELMRKIREQIMLIYNVYFRPIIQVIETMRRMLAILKLANIKWADKLDARLARLEGKIIGVLQEMLAWTNKLPGWFNVLLTAKYLLQYPIFSNSMDAYAGTWVKQFYNAQSKPLTPEEQAAIAAAPPAKPVAVVLGEVRDYLTAGAGPAALPTAEALAHIRAALGG